MLIQNVYNKIVEAHNIVTGKTRDVVDKDCQQHQLEETGDEARIKKEAEDQRTAAVANGKAAMSVAERRNSFRKTTSFTDDSIKKATTAKQPDPIDIYRLNHLVRPHNKDDFLGSSGGVGQEKAGKVAPKSLEAKCYIEKGKINFGKLLTDEVLAADHKLVETVKKMVRSCVRWLVVVAVVRAIVQ